jgi:hypothetical protein
MPSSSLSSVCQYLGLKDDPTTSRTHPSTANYCFHCKVPAVPVLEHQEAYCLAKAHTKCIVYTQPEIKRFPKNIMEPGMGQILGRESIWKFVILAVGILSIGFVLWKVFQSFSAGQVPATSTSVLPVTPSSATPRILLPNITTTSQPPTPILTSVPPIPEPSLTPTEFPPQIHALEVPIMVGDQPFLMHRIIEGEQIISLAKQNQTTIDVLQNINIIPPAPFYAGKVIVIAPGLLVVDPNSPPLKAYQVTDKEIGIKDLAGKLGVDLTMLELYNRCSDACRLVKGEWLLIPPATKVPIPDTPTPLPSPTPGNFRALEAPMMVGKQLILLHRVSSGEQITQLISKYQTTIEVLQEINYKPSVPLIVDQVIVIAPGLIININPTLPPFEPYQVTDEYISITDLASKLSVDLAMLKYYNGCSDDCRLVKGYWLLVPRAK